MLLPRSFSIVFTRLLRDTGRCTLHTITPDFTERHNTMFISLAHASETGAEAAAGNPVLSMLPLLLIILVFYFMVIRPQTKRIEAHRKVIAELNKGDKIVTAGGIIGTISKVVNDEEVRIKIADGIEVTVVRATIMMRRDS